MILNEKQNEEIIRAIEKMNLDPKASTRNASTLEKFVLKKFAQFFVEYDQEILDQKIPINGINIQLKHIYKKLDKRFFSTEKPGRPVKESVNITLSKEVRKLSKGIEKKTGLTLQKLIEANYKEYVLEKTESKETWFVHGLMLTIYRENFMILSVHCDDNIINLYEIIHHTREKEIENEIRKKLTDFSQDDIWNPDDFLKYCKKAGCRIRLYKKNVTPF
jgi:hypothetical protein